MMHSALYDNLRHDLRSIAVFVAVSSVLANFLPPTSKFKSTPRFHTFYCYMVDFVAACAMNWRTQLPSLDQEFLGFRRRIRHGIRNWRQDRLDRRMK